MDSFDVGVFNILKEVVINELRIDTPEEKRTVDVFNEMMDEITILYSAEKLRRNSSVGGEKEEVKEEDYAETLCSICYNVDMDSKYVPCGHTSCSKCIKVHLLNK